MFHTAYYTCERCEHSWHTGWAKHFKIHQMQDSCPKDCCREAIENPEEPHIIKSGDKNVRQS